MTYKELLDTIKTMTPEQQGMDLSVYLKHTCEIMPVESLQFADNYNDILDNTHPYFVIDW